MATHRVLVIQQPFRHFGATFIHCLEQKTRLMPSSGVLLILTTIPQQLDLADALF
jgi:hypothetical protein